MATGDGGPLRTNPGGSPQLGRRPGRAGRRGSDEEAARPLAEAFGRYDVYILPVGSWRHQEVLDRFGDNHDQRVFGNSFLGIGRRLRQLAELEMRPIHPMPEQKLVFFCFDSSRTGDLARGAVERDQLLHMGATYDVENAHGGLADHLKIALVHHHPHPYTPEKEVPIIDPRSWVGREEFIEFRGAPGFLSWCAARDIGLVLHGHKHIPRLVHDRAPIGPEQDAEHREITSVGCGSSLGANGRDLSFNIIEWRPESQSWSVDFRLATGDGRPFRSAAIDSHIQLVDRR